MPRLLQPTNVPRYDEKTELIKGHTNLKPKQRLIKKQRYKAQDNHRHRGQQQVDEAAISLALELPCGKEYPLQVFTQYLSEEGVVQPDTQDQHYD